MEKLIAQLNRLYLPRGEISPDELLRHLRGEQTTSVSLAAPDRHLRAVMIPFDRMARNDELDHWHQLCAVANVLHADLELPTPAVSVSGNKGYGLWMSFETPMPMERVSRFLDLLRKAYFPDMALPPNVLDAPVEIPPCLNQHTGKWAAFIHPGMGASFAEDAGLEMAPPPAGQVAFLEHLESIGSERFAQALDILQRAIDTHASGVATSTPPVEAASPGKQSAASGSTPADDLLLKDATLEDIVRFLHARNIEPTFRHLIPRQDSHKGSQQDEP
ncbi:hypothetical protein [Noviherbaspirillum galbum]|uniref:Uncharacterized protein n=1 Tax=Noviherbaspirillum galbum TaxID=2709383 RepID=A0A6B3SVR6_9BURK|nr:hypothetical protein [Noviherbaspirillum galbum]NEX62996.1 hypothetical protein [Noviherbaspirillum galbum]